MRYGDGAHQLYSVLRVDRCTNKVIDEFLVLMHMPGNTC